MRDPLDRRAFLAAATGFVLAGCGSGSGPRRRHSLATGHHPLATGHHPLATRRHPLATPGARTLQGAIRGHVFTPARPGFTAAAHVYNERFDGVSPAAVARPLDAADVRAAVRWLVGRGVPLRARSGGHSYAGYSTLTGGAVLDLRHLNRIAIDRRVGTATIGAGAQLLDVYAALAAHGATIPAGSCPSVGVAGHALGGGIGLAARRLGLATDSIVAARLVTADGILRTVDARTDPDLLWALRGGGGGNFGVVTDLTFRIHRIPATAAWFFVDFPWSEASTALDAWLHWGPAADDRITSILHLNAGGGGTSVNVSGQFLGAAAQLGGLLAGIRQVPGASVSSGEEAYLGLQLRWAGCLGMPAAECHTVGTTPHGTLARASFDAKSDYVARPLSAAGRSALIGAIEARAGLPGSGAALLDSYGGQINRIHPRATAFVRRDNLACIQYLSYGGGSGWLQRTHAAMRPFVSGFAYQNYIDASLQLWQHAYYGVNYARLQAIRRAVDPHHYFNFPQAIGR